MESKHVYNLEYFFMHVFELHMYMSNKVFVYKSCCFELLKTKEKQSGGCFGCKQEVGYPKMQFSLYVVKIYQT